MRDVDVPMTSRGQVPGTSMVFVDLHDLHRRSDFNDWLGPIARRTPRLERNKVTTPVQVVASYRNLVATIISSTLNQRQNANTYTTDMGDFSDHDAHGGVDAVGAWVHADGVRVAAEARELENEVAGGRPGGARSSGGEAHGVGLVVRAEVERVVVGDDVTELLVRRGVRVRVRRGVVRADRHRHAHVAERHGAVARACDRDAVLLGELERDPPPADGEHRTVDGDLGVGVHDPRHGTAVDLGERHELHDHDLEAAVELEVERAHGAASVKGAHGYAHLVVADVLRVAVRDVRRERYGAVRVGQELYGAVALHDEAGRGAAAGVLLADHLTRAGGGHRGVLQ
eukprot:PhM_4_TR1283/c1_g1_i2/m.7327